MLRRAGVVGDPAGHSLSPAIHRAGYTVHDLPWAYSAHTVTPAELPGFMGNCASDPAWAGLSVTAPHKRAVVSLGQPDEPTRLTGGANTVCFGDEVTVHNTDVPGFVRAWRSRELAPPRRAAIVGNGATAASALLALAELGVGDVVVLVRDPRRAAGMLDLAAQLDVTAHVQGLDPLGAQPGRDETPPLDVVVSTVPTHAIAASAGALVRRAAAVFDVVYHPWPTPLARVAHEAGAAILDGLDLLAGQAVDQFFLMTGHRVSFQDCRVAAEQELNRRARL